MESGILPSRQELLSRIELVCDLDSSFIAVTGEAGIGKSALLEFFIEHHCVDRKKCFIGALPDQTPHQLREQLLFQLLPGSAYDPNLSLVQNISGSQGEDPLDLIIVIDNAQYAEAILFKELLELLKAPGANRVGIIFAQPRDSERLNQLNSRHPLIEIHIEPLSNAESRMLLEFYYRSMLDSERTQVQHFIERCNGLPAKLLQWEDTPTTKAVKLSKKTVVLAVASLFLVTVAVAASWFFIDLERQRQALIKQEIADRASEELAQSELKPDTAPQKTDGEMPATAQVESNSQADASTDNLTNEVKPLTDSQTVEDGIEIETLLVQKWSDTPKKVVTDKSIADSTIIGAVLGIDPADKTNTEKKPGESDKVETLYLGINDNSAVDANANKDDTPQDAIVDSPLPTETPELAKPEAITAKPDKPLNSKMDNQWFLDQTSGQSVVQLTGVSDARVLEDYLVDHQLKNRTHIYQTVRNGKPWYVVTMGPYTNHDVARAAIGQLSVPLQNTKPWVKSISTIQSEISDAN